jgi:hypothetical protein
MKKKSTLIFSIIILKSVSIYGTSCFSLPSRPIKEIHFINYSFLLRTLRNSTANRNQHSIRTPYLVYVENGDKFIMIAQFNIAVVD